MHLTFRSHRTPTCLHHKELFIWTTASAKLRCSTAALNLTNWRIPAEDWEELSILTATQIERHVGDCRLSGHRKGRPVANPRRNARNSGCHILVKQRSDLVIVQALSSSQELVVICAHCGDLLASSRLHQIKTHTNRRDSFRIFINFD